MNIGSKSTIYFELQNYSDRQLNLNFYLGNKLLSREQVYIPTYRASVEQLLKHLNKGDLKNDSLSDRIPSEIIGIFEAERNLNEPQYFRHLFRLDESIDQYLIFVFERGNTTTFIWKCWDGENCNSDHELNKVYFIDMPTDSLISTLEQLNSELKKVAC